MEERSFNRLQMWTSHLWLPAKMDMILIVTCKSGYGIIFTVNRTLIISCKWIHYIDKCLQMPKYVKQESEEFKFCEYLQFFMNEWVSYNDERIYTFKTTATTVKVHSDVNSERPCIIYHIHYYAFRWTTIIIHWCIRSYTCDIYYHCWYCGVNFISIQFNSIQVNLW